MNCKNCKSLTVLCDGLKKLMDAHCAECELKLCEDELDEGGSPIPCNAIFESRKLIELYKPKAETDENNPF